jgi:hypothetical protein
MLALDERDNASDKPAGSCFPPTQQSPQGCMRRSLSVNGSLTPLVIEHVVTAMVAPMSDQRCSSVPALRNELYSSV